jgi:prepilin-type N-terminal cleavage/methylation domain-containing protein
MEKNYKIVKLRLNRGMTFVEMIVALGIFAVIILVISYSIFTFYKYNAYGIEQSSAINSARRGIEPAINNIREATYSDEGAYPIISAAVNSFSFYSDIDSDNNIEKVRIFLDGNIFKKGVTESAGNPPVYNGQPESIFILSDNIINSSRGVDVFKYYDNNGVEVTNLSNISDITFVTMDVIVNVDPNRAPSEFTLRASAAIRNLKSNL